MNTITLGELTVSAQGLGCMGMSSVYGAADWDESTRTIRRALDLGVTLLDTAAGYGDGHNEVLIGRAIAGRRDEVQLATKAGLSYARGKVSLNGAPDHLKASCDASLLRLGVDVIDLYYLHRVAPDVPLEESVGALADLVADGKVRAIGLCEIDGDQLRAAHAIHPITAVQSEYSLWWREPEQTLVDVARELGVGLVPFSPLGRGFLTGALSADTLPADDTRRALPRFADDAMAANASLVEAVRAVAATHDATPAQVALAWVGAQSDRLGIPVVPIPGTKRVHRLEENAAAADLQLSEADLNALDGLGAPGRGRPLLNRARRSVHREPDDRFPVAITPDDAPDLLLLCAREVR
ncbi:aldo/keto reductase [Solirubrobacter phytolaccae]|uniref:Aldo/keto reductase n=1 Tax=Solirubrobacter phytolaccae TaxID=1404360 RepID=A0A9X3N9R7_9ACTN|nr:aldo/keto reductase [Solirubrobacter phytolaccae]MDA0182114.1 aldo/keto reductase [Solirubrobacter phytolaccae]